MAATLHKLPTLSPIRNYKFGSILPNWEDGKPAPVVTSEDQPTTGLEV